MRAAVLVFVLAACGPKVSVNGTVRETRMSAGSAAARMRLQADGTYLGYLAISDVAQLACELDNALEPTPGTGTTSVLPGTTLALRIYASTATNGRHDLREPSGTNSPFVQAFYFKKSSDECIALKAINGFVQFTTASEKASKGTYDFDFGDEEGRLSGSFDIEMSCPWRNAFPLATACQ